MPRSSLRPRQRTFVQNPPKWVTKMLADNFETLEDSVPSPWLPRLDAFEAGDHGRLTARLREYGCGTYGCVFPTLDPQIVLKVTTDSTEAEFAARYANNLPHHFCVFYQQIVTLGENEAGRATYLLWREAADRVGMFVDDIAESRGGRVAAEASKRVKAQWRAGQLAFEALYAGDPPQEIAKTRENWITACAEMGAVEGLTNLANGMIQANRELGVIFGDVHEGNIALVHRPAGSTWVISDPGNIAIYSS